jgi:hypothetical protein
MIGEKTKKEKAFGSLMKTQNATCEISIEWQKDREID